MPADAAAAPITLAELNRATLARQHLLERAGIGPLAMIEALGGMQSQAPAAPFTGLWSRLEGFAFDDLSALMLDRSAVRIVTLRSTVHLHSAADARGLRPLVQPVTDRAFDGNQGRALQAAGVDVDAVTARCVELLATGPLTAKEMVDVTSREWPQAGTTELSQVPRSKLALVQIPPRGTWGGTGQPRYVPLDVWTGAPVEPFTPQELVRRYLGAFGPATVQDAQTWCGLANLRGAFDALGDELIALHGPAGERFFDLVGSPRPDGDTPAPVRILAEFDNLLLSHVDRIRVMDLDRRRSMFTVNGVIPQTVLVDGRVAAVSRPEAAGKGRPARLHVRPFERLTKRVGREIEREGQALLSAMGGKWAEGVVELDAPGTGWEPAAKARGARA